MIRIIEKEQQLREEAIIMLPMEFVKRFNKYPLNDITYSSANRGCVFGAGNSKGILEMDNKYIKILFPNNFLRLTIGNISSIEQITMHPKYQSFMITMNDKSFISFRIFT